MTRSYLVVLISCWMALGALVGARELTGKELCQRLTAEEVSAVVGAGRSAQIGEDRCTYVKTSVPAIRLLNSNSDTREELIELVKTLKGTVQDGPGGSIIYAVAFDLKNGETSGAWFMLNKTAVEIEFDGGLSLAQARALVEAASR